MFDPAQAGALAAFFRTALARDSGQRHASARDMLSAWQAIFANSSVPVAPAETRADAALRLMSDAEALARAIDAAHRTRTSCGKACSDIAGVLARVDPARAEHVAGGLAADRAAALARIAGTVAGTDPAQAAQLLTDAQASLGEDRQFFRWPFPELLLVRRQVIRVVVGRRTLVPVTRSVARIDPAVAGRLLDSAERVVMLDQGLRDELLAGIAEAAAAISAARAEQIARDIDDAGKQAEALGCVASALAYDDPGRAEQIARLLATEATEPSSAGASCAARAFASIARATPATDGPRRERLLARAEQLARRAESHRALTEVASVVAADNRDRALRLLAEAGRHSPDAGSQARMVEVMAGTDPAGAEELARGIAEAADRAVALAHLAVASKQADSSRAVEMVAEAEQTARAVPDPLVRGPQALIQVAVAAAIADPARAESIARSLDHEGANPEPIDRLWTARALVAVADAWLDHSTAPELARLTRPGR